MPIYKIQAPDGRIVSLEGPEGASQAEVIAQAQALYQPQNPPPSMDAPVLDPQPIGETIAPVDQVRPRFQDPQTAMGPFEADPSLGAGFMDTARNVVRKQYELSGNLLDTAANNIDDIVNAAKFNLGKMFIGDQPPPVSDAQPILTAAPSNPVSRFLQEKADQDFANANIITASQLENPVDRRGRTTVDQIIEDPLNIPQALKFGVETAVESAPEMGLAAIPFAGPALFAGSMLQDTAEQRAQNQGRGVRDVTGMDLVESVPSAAASAALERAGIKGLGSEGKNAITRTLKATGKEAITEAAQEPIELAGQTIGTDNPATAADYGKASLGGGLGGATTGGGLKATGEVVSAGYKKATAPFQKEIPEEIPQASQESSPDVKPSTVKQATPEPVTSPSQAPTGEAAPASETQGVAPAGTAAPEADPPIAQPGGTNQQSNARKRVVTPEGDMEIDVEDQIVELDDLITSDNPKFDQSLQPRDRSRATSDLQIQRIASKLDPEQLGESRTTDQGAPIIGPDNMVESGNGRTSAIRKAYGESPEISERYRQSLIAKGYNVEGFKNPVLVRRRVTDMTPEQRAQFTRLSNKSQIAEMSSTEKAQNDAKSISDESLGAYVGGEPDAIDNQDFVQSFISNVVSGNETGALIGKDKRLTQEGVKRIKAALVAKAYDNPELVENIFESADPEVKAVGNVLRDRAPEFAQLGAAVRAGDVPSRFDITRQLMEAVTIIRNARRDKKNIRDVMEGTNQGSLIGEEDIDPIVKKLVQSMYRPDYGRMLSQPHIDRIMKQYTAQAREQKDSDLFGKNKTQPNDLLEAAYEKIVDELEAKANGQGALTFADSGQVEETAPNPDRAETNGSFNDERVPRKPAEDGGVNRSDELAKTGGRGFEDFAKTRGTTKYRTAYVEMGLDPDVTVNQPAEKQLSILGQAMKERFGLRIEIDSRLDRRQALDMLHNIYHNLSFISGVFGLPYKAIGLDNTLTLQLKDKLRGALGSYQPATKTITLPKKSNSFIHEWLHALDDFMLNRVAGDVSEGNLFSGVVRKDGIIDPNDNMQSAFANLMHAIFYDQAMLASIKMDLDHKLERATSSSEKANIQKKLDELEAGNYSGIKGKSNYYKGSKEFGKGQAYWTSPEEMLARVFEAYTAYRIENAGGDPSSIAKGDMAYLSNADSRLEKTFPKLGDRQAIFDAMDQFMARLRENAIFGKEIDKSKPMSLDDFSMFEAADFAYMPEESPWSGGIKSAIQALKRKMIDEQKREVEKWRKGVVRLKEAIIDKKKIEKENPTSKNSALEWLRGAIFSTDRSVMHALEKKYSSPSLTELNNRVFTRPGQGSVVKQDFFFNTRHTTALFKKRLGNLMRNFKAEAISDADMKQIRDIMTSAAKDGSEQAKKIAGSLRKLLDDMYQELKDAGVEIGYLRNQGYLSRLYIKRKILADKEKFLSKAAEVYGIQFDQSVGEIVEDIMADPEIFLEHLRRMVRENPSQLSIPVKDVKKLIEMLKEGVNEDNEQEVQDLLDKIKDDVRDFYSQAAAADWLHRIQFGSDAEFENGVPSSGFTKKRALPPEADKILEDFMETDPFVIADHYAELVGRRVGLARALKPEGKRSYEQLLKDMTKEGVSARDIAIIKDRLDLIFGMKETSAINDAIRPVTSVLHLGGMLSLLDLAAIASLPERFTIVAKTKRVSDALKVIKYTMDQMAGTQSAKEAREAAESLGIIMNEMAAAALDARMGGWREIDAVEKISSQFFIKNGLAMIDNSNRLVAFRVSKAYFEHLSRRLLDHRATAADKDLITRELAEYGIDPERAEAFAKWLTGDVTGDSNGTFQGFADVEALRQSPFGRDLILALSRFNDQVVQRPNASDRPYASKNPVGSLIYAVTSFAFAFYENMVKAEAKKVGYVYKNYGALQGARQTGIMALSWAPLMAATMITNALRVALFDRERWEQMLEDDDMWSYLTLRSLSSMGVFGPVVDHILNVITGVRYQRDIATSFSGAYLSNYFGWLQSLSSASNLSSVLGKGDTNSPNTNTQEYNLIKNTWKAIIAPAITAGLTVLPGGLPMSLLSGLGIAGISSSTAADAVATSMVGEKGGSKKSSSEPQEPKEPKEPQEAD